MSDHRRRLDRIEDALDEADADEMPVVVFCLPGELVDDPRLDECRRRRVVPAGDVATDPPNRPRRSREPRSAYGPSPPGDRRR